MTLEYEGGQESVKFEVDYNGPSTSQILLALFALFVGLWVTVIIYAIGLWHAEGCHKIIEFTTH